MQHVLIITGGHLNIDFAKAYIKTLSYDKVFAVDKGLEYTDSLGLIPDYLLGDFDTVQSELLLSYEKKKRDGVIDTIIERYSPQKDATDTELALNIAIEQGAKQITILAGTGSRIDHVFGNVGLLLQAVTKQVMVCLVDETNCIRMLDAKYNPNCIIERKRQHGKYISLIPLTAKVEGVTVTGALYPLANETIVQGSSLSISNQIVDDKMEIQITTGKALVIESRDS